ncbi:MAG: hypothetical protein IPL88_01055 [Rhizobiales bacterium]|nr:hypothetical protein [Hyphomicrobiales bacterium]
MDFVDIDPDRDMPLFIDPFAISLKGDSWSETCHQHITHFFQTAIDHIRAGRDREARLMLNGLSEPNETCLGLSRGVPAGRGVGGRQAFDLYESLSTSQAARTGLLEELAECDLFIPGIGSDKISDITTNIIRGPLIEYTQRQCALHGIALEAEFPSGRYWDMDAGEWRHKYVEIPVVGHRRLILVPKYTVRRKMALDSQEFYSHHILNFIQQDELDRRSPLVRVLKSGERRPPSKTALRERFPFSKEFVARFSAANPDVLKSYKRLYAEIEGAEGTLNHKDFDHDFDESVFARALASELPSITPGSANANRYHIFIIGVLEFLFWPNLIYPRKEHEVHEGRKRIDIVYTNAAQSGFFWRAHTAHNIASSMIMVECKNYSKDLENPELDQLSGRFSVNRGRLGIMLYRNVDDYGRLCARCRDTAQDGRGYIIALGDAQVIEFLDLIAERSRSAIDSRLQEIFQLLIS